jgi:hypothetical protein
MVLLAICREKYVTLKSNVMEILIKKIKRLKKLALLKRAKSPDSVTPFRENPGIEPESNNMLSADALFSLFTANIIQQKIKFTR